MKRQRMPPARTLQTRVPRQECGDGGDARPWMIRAGREHAPGQWAKPAISVAEYATTPFDQTALVPGAGQKRLGQAATELRIHSTSL
jgi:hypothetical protein